MLLPKQIYDSGAFEVLLNIITICVFIKQLLIETLYEIIELSLPLCNHSLEQ